MPKSYYAQPGRQAQSPSARWLSTAAVCVRYGASPSTITRWQKHATLDFPKPLQVVDGGPNLYSEHELDEFDRRRADQPREPRKADGRVPPPRRRKSALTAACAGDTAATAAPAAGDLTPQPVGRHIITRPAGSQRALQHPSERA